MNLTRIPWKYTTCENNMNFLRQDLRKLSSDRHRDRQTDTQTGLKLYTTPYTNGIIHNVRNYGL